MNALDEAMKVASDRYDAAISATRQLPRGQRKAALDRAYVEYSAECSRALDRLAA